MFSDSAFYVWALEGLIRLFLQSYSHVSSSSFSCFRDTHEDSKKAIKAVIARQFKALGFIT